MLRTEDYAETAGLERLNVIWWKTAGMRGLKITQRKLLA